jgi:cell division inhibitor SepF
MRKTLEYLGFVDSNAGPRAPRERASVRPEAPRGAAPRAVAPVRTLSRSRHEPAYSVIHTMRPRRYQNDAAGIAETFAGGSPIVVDLAMMQEAEVRRIIDFMSGLVKGLDGNIRPVATKVFLLTPAGIEQFDDELDQNSLRLHEDEEFPV